ncbi:DNA gyrase subunit A [Candidatus Berkiella aquae]|uniref:DNA gyrase subunit A n=1 Tax=Candidatus Berkiella aquae TaxID=295108 RepID=A0A0Q9Z0P8_9GAMM|nr:DNA gyrase subunit A [Candidatus Berkiella aquae]MCS5712026.1 DNA gyrase subunit A [Candidatus Berkiella aquae]
MTELAKEVHPVNIEDELKQSYLDYAMSVIVGRALPDVRDGLKPVHRRVLFAMSELGNEWNKPYKKSARVVGDVIGKYHPHGDTAVYDTIVRMAQPFSMRYLLVDGQGNFGSVDGDSAAAMRYTEVRMSRFAHELLKDLDKETVDFVPNYDETEFAPSVLPTRVPNLLVNGASGIAVGMATNIPPHNLKEVISGCLALIDNPDITIDELLHHIPGPDFPTRAMINGRSGIIDAYRTGRGRIYVRARTEIEDNDGRQSIIITELPYQVNKAKLVEKIAELVKDKKIEGISNLRDESDKDGMRVVIELKRNEVAEVILNNLYAQTPMQSVFGINMVALVDNQPRTLNLKQIIECFIRHRRVVVNRRTTYELRKARERAHILEGWSVALANVDEIIQLIKASKTPHEAKDQLIAKAWPPGTVSAMLAQAGADASKPEELSIELGLSAQGYRLSEVQAQAILDLKLQRLTGLEQDKIFKEYEDILKDIAGLIEILVNPNRLMEVIRQELTESRDQFGDERRTEIIATMQDLSNEDLISEEMRVVTISHQGYVKTQPLDAYAAQHRGGRGKAATSVKDEDYVDQLLVANTHDTILCFSSKGKVYWLKVYQLPLGSRNSLGKPIINLIPSLESNERISAILPLREFTDSDTHCVVMATAQGVIKKVNISEFSRPRSSGIIAVDLDENDELVGAETTDGDRDIMLFTNSGKAVRFHENTVRCMGRIARGVRGVKLQEGQRVISLIVVKSDCTILIATENGYGKRTPVSDFPVKGRGGQGVIAIQTTERNGNVIGAVQVENNDEIMLITDGGTLVRTRVDEISVVGRNTQGVTLIQLSNEEKLVGLQRILEVEAKKGSDEQNEEVEGTDTALPDTEVEESDDNE